MSQVIDIKKLDISFRNQYGLVPAVKNVSFKIKPKLVTGIIGESGSGKSVLAMGLLDLLPNYVVKDEEIYIGNENIKYLREKPGFHGNYFGLIPQNAGEALSMSLKISQQFKDTLKKKDYRDTAKNILSKLNFKDIDRVLNSYPHELSGGMLQRVLSSITMSGLPKWLIADEPTKGLDEISLKLTYELFKKIKEEYSMSMIIITHDLRFAEYICDELVIMYDGQVIEQGENILKSPKHPYTQGFLMSLPENGFQAMEGVAPGPYDEIRGCSFYSRCPYKMEKCQDRIPDLYSLEGRKVKCFLYD